MKYLLLALAIVSNSASAEYKRSDFGGWIDVDSNCKDTRVEVLHRDAIEITKENCTIVNGKWIDKYTGLVITDADKIDIDHVIPLKYAYDQGASLWPRATKVAFANDFNNLVSVSSHINRSKGSKGLSQFLPPDQLYRCIYISKWIKLSEQYKITLKDSDLKIITSYRPTCHY